MAALLGSWLDPVLMSGCVLAGWLLKPAWQIILAALCWNFLIYVAQFVLAFHGEGHAVFVISGGQYLGSCAAALTAAFLTRVVAVIDCENPTRQNSLAWGGGPALVLLLALFIWARDAKNTFYEAYDVNGHPCYWERSNFELHYWAMDYPRPILYALIAAAALWLGITLRRRQLPRSYRFLIFTYLYIEFFFWAALNTLDLHQ